MTGTGVLVEVSRTLRQDYTLSLGSSVGGGAGVGRAPLLNSENPEVGHVVANNVLEALPTINRDFQALVALSPGVLPIRGALTRAASQVASVHAGRGVETMSSIWMAACILRRTVSLRLPPVWIRCRNSRLRPAFTNARYGIVRALQLIAVTKSGTNQLHGSVYNFLQHDSLNARNAFQVVKPEFKQNQYGGTIGGPIYIPKLFNGKDKAWFFFSYQGITNRNFATFNVPVPTPAQKSGVFPHAIIDPSTGQPFANNTIPADRSTQFLPGSSNSGRIRTSQER